MKEMGKRKEGEKRLFIEHLLCVRHTLKCFRISELESGRGHEKEKKYLKDITKNQWNFTADFVFTYVYIGISTCAWVGRVGKEKGPKRSNVSITGNQ